MPEERLTRTRAAYVPDAQAQREDEERAERDHEQDQRGKVLARGSLQIGDVMTFTETFEDTTKDVVLVIPPEFINAFMPAAPIQQAYREGRLAPLDEQ